MEKIEEKGIEYLKSIGITGKFQIEGAALRAKDFTNGYTIRNDEVVDELKVRIGKWQRYCEANPFSQITNEVIVDELTDILTKLKEDKK